jgi:hypothetical protein
MVCLDRPQEIAQLTNGDLEHAIGNKGFWPDGGEKLLFGYEDASGQVVKHSESLCSELNRT